MEKFLSVLISVCLLLTTLFVSGVFAANNDVDIDVSDIISNKITDIEGKYKTQGRTSISGEVLWLDYSASGIEFEAECSGDVTVKFNATSIITGEEGGCYFTVVVDGVTQDRDFCVITATGDTDKVIATGLAAGTHTFAIYRQTEIERATVGIKEITVKGKILDAPANSDMYIEFVGDSITTAYGNLAKSSDSVTTPSYPKYQDATQGYAYLTAKNLGADFSLVARQGIGAQIGYQPVNMQTVYPLLRHAKDTSTAYDFARQPDYVVIALGTNDVATYQNATYGGDSSNDETYLKNGFKNMALLVREKNPNAKIIWAYGMMTSATDTIIPAVIEELGGADNNYYCVDLTQNKEGGNGHPYYTAHTVMATELTAYIRTLENNGIEFTPGNVDGQGTVNLSDVSILAQYVAKWNLTAGEDYIEAALDPDGNGSVNLSDVSLLAQYVAKWEVTLSDKAYVPSAS